MSFYAEYIRELLGKQVLESDKGFITYSFIPPDSVYIENVYVSPEYRKSNACFDMADQVVAIAKEKGCKKLLGSVIPSAMNSTTSLKVLLAYGMHLTGSNNDIIFFTKDIQ